MKRLFLFTLVLCILTPACHADGINESLYTGTWIFQEETSNSGFAIEALHLTEDQRVFYLRQFYDREGPTYSCKTVGSWTVMDDGIHINTGESYPEYYTAQQPGVYLPALQLYYPSGLEYRIFIAISSDMLTRMADEALSNVKEESGVYVPGGYWEVGVDIPVGVYSIKKPDNSSSQNFVVFESYNEETGRYTRTIVNTILNKNNPMIGKVELREGNVVMVDEGVYFSEPVKLGF